MKVTRILALAVFAFLGCQSLAEAYMMILSTQQLRSALASATTNFNGLAQPPPTHLSPVTGGTSWQARGFPNCRIVKRQQKYMQCYVVHVTGEATTPTMLRHWFDEQRAAMTSVVPAYQKISASCENNGVAGLKVILRGQSGEPQLMLVGIQSSMLLDIVLTIGSPAMSLPQPGKNATLCS